MFTDLEDRQSEELMRELSKISLKPVQIISHTYEEQKRLREKYEKAKGINYLKPGSERHNV